MILVLSYLIVGKMCFSEHLRRLMIEFANFGTSRGRIVPQRFRSDWIFIVTGLLINSAPSGSASHNAVVVLLIRKEHFYLQIKFTTQV
jgi:hypothetical protein